MCLGDLPAIPLLGEGNSQQRISVHKTSKLCVMEWFQRASTLRPLTTNAFTFSIPLSLPQRASTHATLQTAESLKPGRCDSKVPKQEPRAMIRAHKNGCQICLSKSRNLASDPVSNQHATGGAANLRDEQPSNQASFKTT